MPIRTLTIEGEPYEMGYQHGSALAEEVHALAEERYRLSLEDARAAGCSPSREECLALAAAHLVIQAEHAPAVHEEFRGIADGAKIAPEELLIGNGYTDYRDVLSQSKGSAACECTSFLVKSSASADGRGYLGQTWDMHGSAERFVVLIHRKPKDGPQSVAVTTAGCLSLVGINEAGLAIGNNNLVPTDARPGVIYLALIHAFLSAGEFETARSAVTDLPRASGHNYYVGGPGGRLEDIETTAARHAVIVPPSDTYAHANHFQSEELKGLQTGQPGPNSLRRESRLGARLAQEAGRIDVSVLHEILSDREGAPDCLCRHDDGNARTCAAAIMCPDRREIWACQGPPDMTRLARFGFD